MSVNMMCLTDKYFKLPHEHLTCVCVCTRAHTVAAIYPRYTVCVRFLNSVLVIPSG